ncbi:MAG: hypothetical protein U0Q16_29615 [Bryobacteraceae bacterium]
MFALLGAITTMFAAFTSAMVVRRGLGDDWAGIPMPAFVWWNTALLVASSLVLQSGRRILALALGSLFLAGQAWIWSGIRIAATPGDSFFIVFTVVHALHVLGGLVALRWGKLEFARLYWHFLTGLWIYLVLLFALWGNR